MNNLLKKIEKSKKLQDEFIDHFETHVNFNKFDPSGLDYFLSEIGYDADEDLKADKPWCCPWEWNPEDLIHHKKASLPEGLLLLPEIVPEQFRIMFS